MGEPFMKLLSHCTEWYLAVHKNCYVFQTGLTVSMAFKVDICDS